MRISKMPFTELLDMFADASPTPGGGSASALAASVGLALLGMVAAMPRTREGSEQARRLLDESLEALAHLRDRAVELIDDDAEAYASVIQAYRLPKGTDEERATRKIATQNALRGAADVPLEVMLICQAGLTAAVDVAGHGNPAAASDVGVAVELLLAGQRGASLNVAANLSAIDDQGFVAGASDELRRLQHAAQLLAADVRGALS
jgi:formiminotetrahydrofolate cyclodeaminase